MKLKKAIAGSVLAGAIGLAAAIGGTGTAQASAPSYLAELWANPGILHNSDAAVLLKWGHRACNDNQVPGMTVEQSAINIDNQTNLSYKGAMKIVRAANVFLC
jgi:hypothetical protein